jgi:hypothetical protein
LPTAENPEQALNPDSSDYLKPPEATIYRRLDKEPSGIARARCREPQQILQDTFSTHERTSISYLKMMPDAEIILKSSRFPGEFRLVNKETG